MKRDHAGTSMLRPLAWVAAAGAAAAAYMTFEAQWVECRLADLSVPGLPAAAEGLKVLHLSDIHAGPFPTNERSLRNAVDWALQHKPDLVLLTGDVLGDPLYAEPYLEQLARLHPPLGAFAVTGNHEFGMSKGPLARPRYTDDLWQQAGITLLRDRCVLVPLESRPAGGVSDGPDGDTSCSAPTAGGGPSTAADLLLCGADYLSGGFGLERAAPFTRGGPGPGGPSTSDGTGGAFPILLIHEPPGPDSPLARHFPLAFAGHTHGGQIRIPTLRGLQPVNGEDGTHLGGIYQWGPSDLPEGSRSLLVVSRGIGTSFLPLRLLTRPEAVLWRLV